MLSREPPSLPALLRQWWFLPLLAFALCLRLYGLSDSALWGDESSSLFLARYSPLQLWQHAAHDVHPPLYFFFLHGWVQVVGEGVLSLRLFSALFGTLAVFLGGWLMWRLASARAAFIALLLLALLPTAVRYSQEVRMYSLLGCWLLAATLALLYWLEEGRRRYLLMYAALMTAAFYTHYFSLFGALVQWLWLATLPNSPLRRRDWWLANLAIAALFLPWLPGLLDLIRHMAVLEAGGDVGWQPPVDARSLPSMLWQWLAQSDGNALSWPVLLGAPLLVVAVTLLVLRTDDSRQRGGVLLALYCGLPLLLLYGVSFLSPVFVERYLTAFALGLPLLLALALDRLLQQRRVLGAALLVTLLGLQGIGVGRAIAVDPDEQFDGMAAYVNAHYRAGDRVVVDDILWYLTFRYYNHTGQEPLLYTAPAADGSSGRPGRYGFGSLIDDRQHAFVDRLADLPQDEGRVWLVMSRYNDQEIPDVPATWRRVAQHAGGEVQAILFERTAQRNAAR
ncbi:glycosyltransferase family 39 protein [Pseudomonas nitroreducens]|uniref:glycosyltransferase family 39 protein n=1 Tax=Pseudomonas nitroreducens TaxID=46680 RepID=UPI002658049A|nr:glycosyltransferase family 39 protein [Pseudomonas nitroreducens]MCP1647465.1 4-amino-4-deoxy-L-arabinose transferase-like glycosyltransferase [Pseudomonas nitroreducens]MCP1686041.1 4-amino-4-deoxy-L-arabinose transferase-like glycosyltransferase [Pseudomonas nitroreducens]